MAQKLRLVTYESEGGMMRAAILLLIPLLLLVAPAGAQTDDRLVGRSNGDIDGAGSGGVVNAVMVIYDPIGVYFDVLNDKVSTIGIFRAGSAARIFRF